MTSFKEYDRSSKKSLSCLISFLVFFSIICFFSFYLVATRGPDIGADTRSYIYYFNNLSSSFLDDKFEPLFYFLASIFVFLDLKEFHLFFFINVLTFITLVFFSVKFRGDSVQSEFSYLIILISMLFFSSWYLTAVTNGLRQGLSIPFLFCALYFLTRRKIFQFVVSFAISSLFHYSSVLFLPFLFLFFLRDRFFYFLVLIVALGYPLGLNENVVKFFSDISHIPVYSFIKSYASVSGSYSGFDVRFYIYSIFWIFLFLLLSKFVLNEKRPKFFVALKFYMILLIPYFIFGFGAFSNRFAFPAWFFVPIIQSFFLADLDLGEKFKIIMLMPLLVFSIIHFYLQFDLLVMPF